MKRMKKLLTGLLTLAMTLSMMTMTAFAAEGSGTTATTKMPTIDTERTGSIKIHKYEYNGEDGGTGTGNADDTIPDGATPLAGVEYSVWGRKRSRQTTGRPLHTDRKKASSLLLP